MGPPIGCPLWGRNSASLHLGTTRVHKLSRPAGVGTHVGQWVVLDGGRPDASRFRICNNQGGVEHSWRERMARDYERRSAGTRLVGRFRW